MKQKLIHRLFILSALLISGCQIKSAPTPTPRATQLPSATTPLQSTASANSVEPEFLFATTQNNSGGNHTIAGSIDLFNAAAIDIPLSGEPLWLVGVPYQNSAIFAAALDNGSILAYRISGQQVEQIELNTSSLPAGMPPVLVVKNNEIQLLEPPTDASTLTNPILLANRLVYIANNGDLVFLQNNEITRLAINALPDARILTDDNQRILLLTQPTDRYDHGVLGDRLEAGAITWVETQPHIRELYTIQINEPDVIEGISPLWADINNDGLLEVMVTLSNADSGSRIAVFSDDGSLLAQSDPIGSGYRWRHQIAAADFLNEDIPLLAVVRTPHIGGVVEFFALQNNRLESITEISGYRSHNIGSRNLDSALAADLDRDGLPELLVPNQAQTHLCVLSPAGEDFCLPLDGRLSSNFSAVDLNGNLIIAAATHGQIRIWTP